MRHWRLKVFSLLFVLSCKGRMTLSAPGELNASALRDPKSFAAWDGEPLHLADGRYLATSTP